MKALINQMDTCAGYSENKIQLLGLSYGNTVAQKMINNFNIFSYLQWI